MIATLTGAAACDAASEAVAHAPTARAATTPTPRIFQLRSLCLLTGSALLPMVRWCQTILPAVDQRSTGRQRPAIARFRPPSRPVPHLLSTTCLPVETTVPRARLDHRARARR